MSNTIEQVRILRTRVIARIEEAELALEVARSELADIDTTLRVLGGIANGASDAGKDYVSFGNVDTGEVRARPGGSLRAGDAPSFRRGSGQRAADSGNEAVLELIDEASELSVVHPFRVAPS